MRMRIKSCITKTQNDINIHREHIHVSRAGLLTITPISTCTSHVLENG